MLDENVRSELFRFLRNSHLDVKFVPKSCSDKWVQTISKAENRIIVTNDEDFTFCSAEEVFSVVWLRIPQNNPEILLSSFEKMVKGVRKFVGQLIVLHPDKWDELPLVIKVEA